MASTRLREAYLRERRRDGGGIVGEAAIWALRDARTRLKWAALEDADLVRIVVEDDDLTHDDLCDCDDDDCPDRTNPSYAVIGQYRLSEDDRWQTGASLCGMVGYDDPADTDETPCVMRETMREFIKARKARLEMMGDRKAGRCPECHGTGRLA